MAALGPVFSASSAASSPEILAAALPEDRIASAAERGFQYVCDHCHALRERVQRCGRCFAALYCNQDCQKAHWKTAHKVQQCCPSAVRLLNAQGKLEDVPMFPGNAEVVCGMKNADGTYRPITVQEFRRLTGTYFCLWHPGKDPALHAGKTLVASRSIFHNLKILHLFPQHPHHHIPELDAIIRNPAKHVFLDHNPKTGFGLVAAHPIKRGTPLFFFAGRIETLPKDQITKRQHDYRFAGIDPAYHGNLAFLLNDGLDCAIETCLINYLGKPTALFLAGRDIPQGAKITWPYGSPTALRWNTMQIDPAAYQDLVVFVQRYPPSEIESFNIDVRYRWNQVFLCPKALCLLALDGHFKEKDFIRFSKTSQLQQPNQHDDYARLQQLIQYFETLVPSRDLCKQVRQRIDQKGLGQFFIVHGAIKAFPTLFQEDPTSFFILWDMLDQFVHSMRGSSEGSYAHYLDRHRVCDTPIPVESLFAQWCQLSPALQSVFSRAALNYTRAFRSSLGEDPDQLFQSKNDAILALVKLMREHRVTMQQSSQHQTYKG